MAGSASATDAISPAMGRSSGLTAPGVAPGAMTASTRRSIRSAGVAPISFMFMPTPRPAQRYTRRFRSGLERCRRPASARAQRVGGRVVRDPEEPRAKARAVVPEAVDRRQRREEGPLGRVFGVMVVTEQVEGIAVDAFDVSPIKDLEPRGVSLRGTDRRQVGVALGHRRSLSCRARAGAHEAGT